MRRFASLPGKFAGILLAAAFFALPAQAQWAVVSVRSIERAVADARYVLKMAGREDFVAPLDAFLAGYLAKGVDAKRPFGLCLTGFGDPPHLVAFLPITSEADLLEQLKAFSIEVGEAEKGIRSLDLPVGGRLHFRIDPEKKYLFAAQDPALLSGKLPDPAASLSAAGKNPLLSLSVRLDQIPAETKRQFFQKLDDDLKREAKRLPAKREGESDAERHARLFGVNLVAGLARQLADEGKELSVGFSIDQTLHNLAFDVDLVARPGTKLAQAIQEFGAARSFFSGLTTDAAASFFAKLPIPPDLRQELNGLIDRGFQEALRDEPSPLKKAVAEKIYQTLEPTLKSEALDLALALNGPLPDGKYALVGGLRLKDGLKIEALVKELLLQMPEAERKKAGVRLDRAPAAGANILSFAPSEKDERTQQLFGSQEIFIAFREDLVLFSLGSHGEGQLKQALAALGTKRDTGRAVSMQAELAFSKLAPMIPADADRVLKAAKESFQDARHDRLRATLQGGDALRLRLDVSAYFIKFAAALAGLDAAGP